jgi:plastocyanin
MGGGRTGGRRPGGAQGGQRIDPEAMQGFITLAMRAPPRLTIRFTDSTVAFSPGDEAQWFRMDNRSHGLVYPDGTEMEVRVRWRRGQLHMQQSTAVGTITKRYYPSPTTRHLYEVVTVEFRMGNRQIEFRRVYDPAG